MSKLPKIDYPVYKINIPSLKKDYQFRPFLVKEEKIFLMATESDDEESVLTAIKQIVNNCCLTEDIDIDTLPISDLEYIFFNLRAMPKSRFSSFTPSCLISLAASLSVLFGIPASVSLLAIVLPP